MKKYTLLNIILFTVFVIWTTIVLFIVYKDIDPPLATKIVIGYIIYLLLYALCCTALILINLRKLHWIEIRKKLFTFIAWFILLSVSLFLFNYLFRPTEINIWDFGTPLGLSLAIAFSDIMFFGKKKL